MRLVAILVSLLLAEHAYAFSSAIYGEFRNTLPSTVTVELTNRSGSVYRRMTITLAGTGKSPITNGTARVFDSTRHPVARGVTVKPGEKPLFDFEHKTFYYAFAPEKSSLSPFAREEAGSSSPLTKRGSAQFSDLNDRATDVGSEQR
jgi:hypothetical protein